MFNLLVFLAYVYHDSRFRECKKKIILMLSSHLHLGLPSGLFPSGFPTKIHYTPQTSSIRATRPVYLILLDLITRTILGEEYRLLSSQLCTYLHSPKAISFII